MLFGKRKFNLKEAISKNTEYLLKNELSIQDVEKQFTKSNTIDVLKIEDVNFPTGNIIISDSISNLPFNRYSPILENNILVDSYTLEISIMKNKNIGTKVCAIKLKINENDVVKYELSRFLEETSVKEGKRYGVPINEGMISICDARDALEYQNFISNWNLKNGNKNFYHDYLKRFFKKDYNGIDYIEWINPYSKDKLLMFPSGFEKAFYQIFIGLDKDNQICEIVVPMLNSTFFE